MFGQVDARQSDLDEAVQLQEALLLLVFQNFRDILCEGHAEIAASAAEPAEDDDSEMPSTGLPLPCCMRHGVISLPAGASHLLSDQ